jgi:hypothetical protein
LCCASGQGGGQGSSGQAGSICSHWRRRESQSRQARAHTPTPTRPQSAERRRARFRCTLAHLAHLTRFPQPSSALATSLAGFRCLSGRAREHATRRLDCSPPALLALRLPLRLPLPLPRPVRRAVHAANSFCGPPRLLLECSLQRAVGRTHFGRYERCGASTAPAPVLHGSPKHRTAVSKHSSSAGCSPVASPVLTHGRTLPPASAIGPTMHGTALHCTALAPTSPRAFGASSRSRNMVARSRLPSMY